MAMSPNCMLYCYIGNNEELHCMQGAAPPYLALAVSVWLVNHITGRWTGRRGQTEWRLRSPRLTARDLVLWRWTKDEVYHSNHTSARRISISHRTAMFHFILELFY